MISASSGVPEAPATGDRFLSRLREFLEFIGNLGLFALRAARRAFLPPFEVTMIWRQLAEIGYGSLPLGMRVNEEIHAVEVLSLDSFKLLVMSRIIACIIALPILTVFMDVAGIAGGFLAERSASHVSMHLYLNRAFSLLSWATFIPPTLKTTVFVFIIALVSSWFGYTAKDGTVGVGRVATNSVVTSSLLIILTDVILVKAILFLFPTTAI